MDLIVDELSLAILVHVDAARLPVVDLTVDDARVRSSFHLEAGNAVVVNVVAVKVSLHRKYNSSKLDRLSSDNCKS